MLIQLTSAGEIRTVPPTVPQGTLNRNIAVVLPKSTGAVILRILPPSQKYIPDIICDCSLSDDGLLFVYTALLPKEVTEYAGRAEYQLLLCNSNGETELSCVGSFEVTRGVPTDMPDSAGELSGFTLSQIYALLSSTMGIYDVVSEIGERQLTLEQSLQERIDIYLGDAVSSSLEEEY